jgi:hypothetical protein
MDLGFSHWPIQMAEELRELLVEMQAKVAGKRDGAS